MLPNMPRPVLRSTAPMAVGWNTKSPVSSPGAPWALGDTSTTRFSYSSPRPTGMVTLVSTSVMACPSAPNRPVSGSVKVRVPTPAVLSRTHAPSRQCPSRPSSAGVTSFVMRSPPRSTSSRSVSPPSTIPVSASALSTDRPFTFLMMSPVLMPAARMGLGVCPRSEAPTTIKPSVSMAMPTDCPPGISTRSGSTDTFTVLTGSTPSRL